jgi:hypothetical protein
LPKSIVALYYWLTPLFWVLDAALGWNVRAAALEGEPGLKNLYYLFCIGCGITIWRWPGLTRIVGLTEASLNVLVLILGVLLPYYRLIDQLAASEPIVPPVVFGLFDALSFFLAGGVWAISFSLNVEKTGNPLSLWDFRA